MFWYNKKNVCMYTCTYMGLSFGLVRIIYLEPHVSALVLLAGGLHEVRNLQLRMYSARDVPLP